MGGGGIEFAAPPAIFRVYLGFRPSGAVDAVLGSVSYSGRVHFNCLSNLTLINMPKVQEFVSSRNFVRILSFFASLPELLQIMRTLVLWYFET